MMIDNDELRKSRTWLLVELSVPSSAPSSATGSLPTVFDPNSSTNTFHPSASQEEKEKMSKAPLFKCHCPDSENDSARTVCYRNGGLDHQR